MPLELFRYWNINFKKLAYSSDADKHDSPHQTCIAVWLHTKRDKMLQHFSTEIQFCLHDSVAWWGFNASSGWNDTLLKWTCLSEDWSRSLIQWFNSVKGSVSPF